MPPTPKNRRTRGEARKFERPSHLGKTLFIDILYSQQTDTSGYLADTLLICDGGTIKIHAFLLQMASPFFQDAIVSQGENYPFIREVLLPDFPVKEIERMLTLVYKGYVDLKNEKEVRSLEETLTFFRIKGAVAFTSRTSSEVEHGVERFKGSLMVNEFNRIPQDIFKADTSILNKSENTNTISKSEDSSKNEGEPTAGSSKGRKRETSEVPTNIMIPTALTARRAGGRLRPTAGLKKYNDDPDFKADSNNESSDDDNEKRTKTSNDKSKGKKNPVIKLTKFIPTRSAIPSHSNISNGSANNSPTKSIKSPESRPQFVKPTFIKPSEEEDLETDEEDKDWEPPNYNDKAWMAKEAMRCQACNKQYEKHGDALCCVTSKHKALRCYFCFRVYSSTEILFRHFAKRHKQAAGRDKTVMCHYCDSMVPYKSVSCHVISVHLKTRQDNNDSNVSNTPRPGRPCTIPTATITAKGSSSSPSKSSGRVISSRSQSPDDSTKAKKRVRKDSPDKKVGPSTKKTKGNVNNVLKVEDLDITFEKKTVSGKVLTFRIQKSRLSGSVNPFRIK